MTAVLEQPAGLATLTDDELTAMYATADDATIAALTAECDRRDREARIAAGRKAASRGYEALRLEWYENIAYPEFQQAQAYCSGGKMLSRLGEQNTDEPSVLWTGSEDDAQAWSSEELKAWWLDHPRTTFRAWLRQRARGLRAQRDEHAMESSSSGRNGAGPATGTTLPQRSKHTANMPVMQAKQTAAGSRMRGNMDVTDQAPPVLAPGELAARSAARKTRLNDARDRMGIPRPAAGTVAVREAGTVTGRAPQIDGAALLGYVRAFVTKYTYLTPAQADAVTLWIGHTHARDEEGFLAARCSPRLYALSSKPGSGKSTLLEHCGRLCPATFGLDTEPSEAGLVYSISKEHATILLDEADVLFGSGKRKQAVRAVINAGYMPNGTVLKVRGGKGERVRIYGALALAGLDVMEKATNGVLDALLTRGVIVRMKQAPEGHELPEMSRDDESAAAKLKMVLEKWGTAGRDEMADLEVEVPDGIRNRQAQIWKTLLRVGKFAGGDWYDRAYAACEALALAGADDDADRTAEIMDELAGVFGTGIED